MREIIAAIVTSLIASVMFWVVFNLIPERRERKKMKPLIDFDLYQICRELASFLQIPFQHSMRSPALNQHQIFYGQVSMEEYRRILYTKCLSEDYQHVDDVAKDLIPIGDELKNRSKDILDRIQNIYIFNKYLTAEQILLCRKIADRLTIYSYDMEAFIKDGERVMMPLDPTLAYMSTMFYELHQLYKRLLYYLIKQKPSQNDLGDFYQRLYQEKLDVLYQQKQYKKIIKKVKGKKDSFSNTYYFRSLLHLGRIAKATLSIKDYLQTEHMMLIYLRGYFSDFYSKPDVKNLLISARSEAEYQEMVDCILEEENYWQAFVKSADEVRNYYENKLASHLKANAQKKGLDIKEVKFN